MSYLALKHLHVTLALLSLIGFLFRIGLRLQDSPRLEQRWLKIVPHINDTALLILGVTLAVQAGYSPMQNSWLAVKILALLGYIGLGVVALRVAKQRRTQWIGAIGALLLYALMVHLAIAKALPF